jgi:hypothetical protein
MGKFGKELIESMQQAVRHAAGKKGMAKGFKLHRRGFATAELSDEQAKTIESSRMDERDEDK